MRTRLWSNRRRDDGSVHAVGNGRMIVYGQGPDLIHVQGPIYSMPSFGAVRLTDEAPLACESQREAGAAIWRHTVCRNGRPAAVFTDGIHPEHTAFVREIRAQQPLTLSLEPVTCCKSHFLRDYDLGSRRADVVMSVIPKGTEFFVGCATLHEARLLLVAEGCVRLDPDRAAVHVEAGEGRLWVITGEAPALPGVVGKVIEEGGDALLAASRAFFADFLKRGRAVSSMIPPEHPQRERLQESFESVSLLIKCQQAADGGILAGHCYPMAYVRDQAGAMRGLLKMGYAAEAKAVLAFWRHKWTLYGYLCNAEGMGNDAARLAFPNDEVEIPAYVILCAMEYGGHTGDWTYVGELFPMLRWAMEAQLRHLADGMTGFSGDETYIAGHTFPREFIYHGSAESTMLFIEGGDRFLAFAEQTARLNPDDRARYRRALDDARARYNANFIRDGLLYANNPAREAACPPPRYHHGFCERHEYIDGSLELTWVERGADAYYRCPACYGKPMPSTLPDPQGKYLLSSISLLPAYHAVKLFTEEQIAAFARPFITLYEKRGYIPSNAGGNRSLGYDFGLLLCTLTRLNHPLKERALETLLDIVDPTGAWVEYYDDLQPFNCRCRAWESGVNIEAIVRYLQA